MSLSSRFQHTLTSSRHLVQTPLALYQKGSSVLKKSLVPSSDTWPRAKNLNFVVFWSYFLSVCVLFWTTDRSDNDFFNKLVRF